MRSVESGEVPGERGLDVRSRAVSWSRISPIEHDVGVRAEDRAQRRRERQAGLGAGLHLFDAGRAVTPPVLDRDDADLGLC